MNFLRLSHQAFRKHRLSLFLDRAVQSFVEGVVALDSWSLRPLSQVLGAFSPLACPCLQRQREVVVVALVVVVVVVSRLVVVVVQERKSVQERSYSEVLSPVELVPDHLA